MTSHRSPSGILFATLLLAATASGPVQASDTFEQAKITAGESLFGAQLAAFRAGLPPPEVPAAALS